MTPRCYAFVLHRQCLFSRMFEYFALLNIVWERNGLGPRTYKHKTPIETPQTSPALNSYKTNQGQTHINRVSSLLWSSLITSSAYQIRVPKRMERHDGGGGRPTEKKNMLRGGVRKHQPARRGNEGNTTKKQKSKTERTQATPRKRRRDKNNSRQKSQQLAIVMLSGLDP